MAEKSPGVGERQRCLQYVSAALRIANPFGNRRAITNCAAEYEVVDLQADQIAATQFAVYLEVEERKVAEMGSQDDCEQGRLKMEYFAGSNVLQRIRA